MTLLTALAAEKAAYLVTDTATYNINGRVLGFASKVVTLPHMQMAFATSGAREDSETVAILLTEFASFDWVVTGAGEEIRGLADRYLLGGVHMAGFRLVVIGWSDVRGRAESYVMSSGEPGLDPFTFVPAPFLHTPPVCVDVLRRKGFLVGDVADIADHPEDWLVRLIDLQRAVAAAPFGSSAPGGEQLKHVVGGQAVLTKLTRYGIGQRVLRSWSDRIGDFIEPERAA